MLYPKGVDQISIKGDVYTWYKRSLNLLSLPGFILDIWMKILPWRFTFKSIVFKLKIIKYSVFLRDRIKMMIFRIEPNGTCGIAPRFFQILLSLCYRIFFLSNVWKLYKVFKLWIFKSRDILVWSGLFSKIYNALSLLIWQKWDILAWKFTRNELGLVKCVCVVVMCWLETFLRNDSFRK